MEHTQEYLRTQLRFGEWWEIIFCGKTWEVLIAKGQNGELAVCLDAPQNSWWCSLIDEVKLIRPLSPKHQFQLGDVFEDLLGKRHTVAETSEAFVSVKSPGITDFGGGECVRIIQPEKKEVELPRELLEKVRGYKTIDVDLALKLWKEAYLAGKKEVK